MDKNIFWLGGRLFNMASPRLGAPTQYKANVQGKMGAQTQRQGIVKDYKLGDYLIWPQKVQRKARLQVGRPNATQGTSKQRTNARHVHNARHVRPSAIWVPQRNARHVCKMGATTQCKACLQDGRPNAKFICNENIHTKEH
jgi:hypothetical protein